jgi:hypothetical protein
MAKKSSKTLSPKMLVRRSVETQTRRIVRVGRNEPCPCGSGRKYKECHEREGDAFLLKLAQEREKQKRLEQQRKAGVPWYKRLLSRMQP